MVKKNSYLVKREAYLGGCLLYSVFGLLFSVRPLCHPSATLGTASAVNKKRRLIVFDLTVGVSYPSVIMKRLLASCFGLGRLPWAPGTWGSLPSAIIFGLMCYLHTPSIIISIVMAALALAGSVICVKFAPDVIAAVGKSDPGEIVVDELAGQAVTFLPIGFWIIIEEISIRQIWIVMVLGFLLFRVFDIAKPWPIRKLEKLPQGWGVLADDLMAGVYAWIVLQFCIRVWIAG